MSAYQGFIDNLKKDTDPDKISDEEQKSKHNNLIETRSKKILSEIEENTTEIIETKKIIDNEFQERHQELWHEGLTKLEIFIEACIKAGSMLYKKREIKKVESEEELLIDLLVRLQAKCCSISNEILYLLRGGYADAAEARWRALHEVNATLQFISKHGAECAQRFLDHEIIDAYKSMEMHTKYKHRLRTKGPSQDEIDRTRSVYNMTLEKYGKDFEQQYGWASIYFGNIKKVGFKSIEKDVNLDHMRPYFKWASQNIHASYSTITKSLTLPAYNANIINVGPSNYGLPVPADCTALSLGQATSFLLMHNANTERIALAKAIIALIEQVGFTFINASKKL